MKKWDILNKELFQATENRDVAILFSGGKDSTALTFALLNSLERKLHKPKRIWILYSNTMVDPPPLLATAKKSLALFQNLGKKINAQIIPKILIPKLEDRFWILLIGKGYPPPSIRFRWCSNRLKIKPVKNFLKEIKLKSGTFPVVLSGIRLNETSHRKKNLSSKITKDKWMKYAGLNGCKVYAPLLYFDTQEIWEYIHYNEKKWKINLGYLKNLYSITSSQINDFRTGCWVCTLII